MREGLRAVITQFFPSARIIEAGTSAEALIKAVELRPQLSILDINLPDLHGLELARRLRVLDLRMRILFLAGEVDPWTVREALDAGAGGFLTKTNAAHQLAGAIRAVMAGEIFFCEASAAALQRAEATGLPGSEPPGLAILSGREQQVLKLIAQGHTTKAIALELQVSPKTIETHRQHIMRKLRLDNIADLTCYAIRHRLRSA